MLTVYLAASLVSSGAAAPGYLATVGPAPLRFRSLITVVTPRSQPIVTVNQPPVATVVTNESAATPAPHVTLDTNSPVIVPPTPAAITNEVYMTPALRPDDVISPQMLLRYFNRSTNGTSTTILAPLNVTPAKPAEPPSSKATYSN